MTRAYSEQTGVPMFLASLAFAGPDLQIAATGSTSLVTPTPIARDQHLDAEVRWTPRRLPSLIGSVTVGRYAWDLSEVWDSDASAHSRWGQVHVGLGQTWSHGQHRLVVTIGPSIGASGFDGRAARTLANEGLQPDPGSTYTRAEVRVRAATSRSSVGVALEHRAAVEVRHPRRRYLGGPYAGQTVDGGTTGLTLVHTPTAEVMVHTWSRLWFTAGLRLELSDTVSPRPPGTPMVHLQIDSLAVVGGIRWR